MVRELPLTRGMVALVDDNEFDRCNQYNWSVNASSGGRFYASRGIYQGDKYFRIFLHRFILGVPDGVIIDHIDGDPLNNQKSNLRACNHKQNSWNSYRAHPKPIVTDDGLFSAQVTVDGRVKRFGTYATQDEADEVIRAALVLTRGDYTKVSREDIAPWASEIVLRVLNGKRGPSAGHQYLQPTDADRKAVRLEVRKRFAEGNILGKALAAEYGCSIPLIFVILRTDQYGDGLQPQIDRIKRANRSASCARNIGRGRRHLTPDQVIDIRSRYKPHLVTAASLAAEYGTTPACIYGIVNGYTYRSVRNEAAA